MANGSGRPPKMSWRINAHWVFKHRGLLDGNHDVFLKRMCRETRANTEDLEHLQQLVRVVRKRGGFDGYGEREGPQDGFLL